MHTSSEVFAECPRCGGWARREASRGRARCRGCNWSGPLPVHVTTAG